jgi:hypothetical protein
MNFKIIFGVYFLSLLIIGFNILNENHAASDKKSLKTTENRFTKYKEIYNEKFLEFRNKGFGTKRARQYAHECAKWDSLLKH